MASEKDWEALEKELLKTELGSNVNDLAMSLIMASPKESEELITDFFRSVMLVGWNEETKNVFFIYLNILI